MQTLSPTIAARPSTFSTIKYAIRESGVRSLYTGLSASLMRQMSYSLVRIGTYESLKSRMSQDGNKPTAARLLLAACLAGALGGLAGNPAGA